MSYLRGFAPWIVYSAVSPFGWQWAALAALLTAAVSLLADRRAGTTLDAQILDIGSVIYFAALTALALTDPASPLQHIDGPLASTWLALIAGTSLIIRRPFTLGIARRKVSAEIADNAQFVHTNIVITSIWTNAFVLQAVAGFVFAAINAGTLADVARQLVGFGLAFYLTHRYVARLRAAQAATVPMSAVA